MNQFIKPIIIATLILLLPPVAVLMAGWQWQPMGEYLWLEILYWITNTSGEPWCYLVFLFFILGLLRLFATSARQGGILVAIVLGLLLTGQGIKALVKNTAKEPRPYVIWLEKNYRVPTDEFYQHQRKQRAELLQRYLKADDRIPQWQLTHWKRETGYAFPSGHTLFAASLSLLLVGFLWPRRRYILSIIVTIWAMCVLISRMALGMHWPQDIITSTLISAVLVIVICYLTEKWRLINDKKDLAV
ncbi:phosphatidylglycerophosphatase B [Photorhabdus luminescens]|uniref:undecaprenyl-diphosphate phosphatase n=1 Tax=Photorhabdus luminescens subsp. mexicana TaxID=2100167 RepID=A0A4R4JJV1_PHOLU|nr:phosphatidylglycerophosphatase B [Photorhabdus luminescens]TDB54393.1 phosphatidylglycerophosphatase B [Photorhabdus luminescens subsp. mexicana]